MKLVLTFWIFALINFVFNLFLEFAEGMIEESGQSFEEHQNQLDREFEANNVKKKKKPRIIDQRQAAEYELDCDSEDEVESAPKPTG